MLDYFHMSSKFLSLSSALVIFISASFAAEWNIDPMHSQANFAVKHMMVSTVHGSFNGLKGSVDYDPAHPKATKAELTIDATTVDTRNDMRDKDLKSDHFFDVAKFPTITFVSTKVEPAGEGKLKISGDMTLHGVTKEVTWLVEGPAAGVKDQKGNLHSGATATTTVNRKDFGLTWNKTLDGGGVMVSDEVELSVEVELVEKK
jgi:polyisoprenoid-binding protein YceI